MNKMKQKTLKVWLILLLTAGMIIPEGRLFEKKMTVAQEEEGEYKEMMTDGEFNNTTLSENDEIIRFLIETFPGDDRALSGEYSKSMLDVSEQYLAVKSKMKKKYPSYDVEIIRCDPKSLLGPAYNVFFVTQDKGKKSEGSAVYVYENKTGDTTTFEIKDAFIGSIMQPVYEELLLQNLQEIIPECYLVNTQMTDVYGDEYDEKLTPEAVLSGQYPMWNRTKILADGSGADADMLLEKIKSFLEKNTCCGSYQILITEGTDRAEQVIKKGTLILPLPGTGHE